MSKRWLVALLAVLGNLVLPLLSPLAQAAAQENTDVIQICDVHGITLITVDANGNEVPTKSFSHIDCLERCASLANRTNLDPLLLPEPIRWVETVAALWRAKPVRLVQDKAVFQITLSPLGSRAPPVVS